MMKRSSSYRHTADVKTLPQTGINTRKRNASASSIWLKQMADFNPDYLCDRTVVFSETNFSCNIVSVEWAEKSLFFEKLLMYHHSKSPIFLPQFIYPVFTNILQFIRIGGTNITTENVVDLFLASDYLQIIDLKKKCTFFIEKFSNEPSIAIQLWLHTKNLFWPEIGLMAYSKVLQHFERACLSQEFLELTFPDTLQILQDDNLDVTSEKTILDAALKWLSYGAEKRLIYADDLLMCCRLGLLDEKIINELKIKSIFQSFLNFKSVLDTWPVCLRNQQQSAILTKNILRILTPRTPQQAVLVLGGWAEHQGPKAAAQVYDPNADGWTLWSGETTTATADGLHATNSLGNMPRRVYAGCVIVQNRIFIIGGYDGYQAQKSTLCFDLVTMDGWTEISCMYEKRYYVSVANTDEHIYAMGGHNGDFDSQRLNTSERYSIVENVWRPISSMNMIRSDAAAAELHGKVYIAGGFDGREYHKTAEYYDPHTDKWTLIASMNINRGGVSLSRHGNYLYAIGGNNGNQRVSEIERYDLMSGRWIIVGHMNTQKSNLSSTVIGDDIYIIGGWSDEQDSGGILDLVEKFNVKTGICHNVASLKYPASATCACTIHDRNIVSHYVFRDPKHLVERTLKRVCGDISNHQTIT